MKITVTAKEREEFRGIFPRNYAKVVSKRLNDAGLQPVRAKEYNPKIVSDVVAGLQGDFNVLLELFRYKDEILTKQEELKKLRNKYNPGDKDNLPKTQK